MDPRLRFAGVESSIPNLEPPFAVLLEADDEFWRKDSSLNIRASALLAAGCRYFVCFGEQSETVHDRIDDIIVEHGYDGVTTTFHCDESEQDVADFFMTIAFSAMNGALVLSCNQEKWMERLLSSGG